MFVVLEGLDGAGKSTQVKMLRKYLQAVVSDLAYIHFPRYEAPVYGDLISRFLRGEFGNLQSVHPQLVALLFAEDRHAAAGEMRGILDAGGSVLLDRYVYSNIAYQCAKLDDEKQRRKLRNWIFDTEYGAFGLPRPDVNIFLDVPIGFVEKKLRDGRDGDERAYLAGNRDIHEADMLFQRRVRMMYLEEVAEDEGFVRVSCEDQMGEMLPPEAIFERIKVEVDKILLER